jgi:hypothetical protein
VSTLANNDDVVLYLLGPRRRLSPETIVERRLGYVSKQWPLTKHLPEDKDFKRADMRQPASSPKAIAATTGTTRSAC